MSAINPADAFRGDGSKPTMPSGRQTTAQGTFTYGGFGISDDEATRQKEKVADFDTDFALKMLSSVAPRSFKWKDQKEQTRRIVHPTRKPRTKTETFEEVVREVKVVNGVEVAVETKKPVQREVPVTRAISVLDDNGQPVIDVTPAKWHEGKMLVPEVSRPRMHHVEVMDDVEEVQEFVTPAKANVRTHYGFIAQEVEAAVQGTGRTTAEFAGLIKDADTGIYGLRMDQMVPLLWAVVRDQQKELAALKAALPAKG